MIEVMDAIHSRDPARYEKILAILAAAEKLGCHADLGKELNVRFGVTAAKCTGYALMSEPPKTRLAFTLDGTQYSTIWVPSRSSRTNAD